MRDELIYPHIALVTCKLCRKDFETRWPEGNRRWLLAAIAAANAKHRELSPDCESAIFNFGFPQLPSGYFGALATSNPASAATSNAT